MCLCPAPIGRIAVLASLLLASHASAQPLISELCDPRLNYQSDRFIEIHNPGAATLELDGWELTAMANGGPAFTWELSGQILPGEALVAGDATTVAVFPVAFAAEGWSGANGSWNGKVGDGAVLRDPQGVAVDSVVVPGTAFENESLTRRPEVEQPRWGYDPIEWTALAVELASDATPGTHNAVQQPDGPVIGAIRTVPLHPRAGEPVHVIAEVTDEATITAVTLDWGLAAGSLDEVIPMTWMSGAEYTTTTSIPPHASGSTVYYRVTATNDLPAVTESPLRHFDLPHELSLVAIQGEGDASPYDGTPVLTRGVVTAFFGNTFVIQDGATGLWARGGAVPARGDSLLVAGRIDESATPAETGLTLMSEADRWETWPGATLPIAESVASGAAGSESLEGALVRIAGSCLASGPEGWILDDGSGPCTVGRLGVVVVPTLGSDYSVVGVMRQAGGEWSLEPRDVIDVTWTGDSAAPVLSSVAVLGPTRLRLGFSEALEPGEAGDPAHYAVDGQPVAAATPGPAAHQATLTVAPLSSGVHSLAIQGVADLHGNAMVETLLSFEALDSGEPLGYYDAAEGQSGEALQEALHGIISGHDAHSYDYAWTAYQTTDVRPDTFRVWDIYSDIPGGTPPYLYQFGVDQGGVGGLEGTGYTREHTWCKNWFGGEVMPMYADLFALYPCDTHMNGTRGVFPYGETDTPSLVSLNGSRVGPSSVAGYTDTVFEPIDEFKGDLARVYFYFATRYLGEDEGWPGGPANEGAALRPWALELYRAWHEADPVSQKEIDRNNAVFAIQGNRNPFVDRPGLVEEIHGTSSLSPGRPAGERPARFQLAAHPNPFNPSTTLEVTLERPELVGLKLYNLAGREMARLLEGQPLAAGTHRVLWDGCGNNGWPAASGLYIARLETQSGSASIRLLLLR